jgi:DNA polymerase-3 subunit delta'
MHWQIHAQEWAVDLLKSHASSDKLRHAYLFTGPKGVGRKTLAIRFAQALNCTASPAPGEFCGDCRDCRQIEALTHPDLSLLQPEEDHKNILIDQVRALQHTLALSPYAGAYRIALLPNFQRATTQAANALLKTLEEPPDRVILLLTANAPEGLLPTIVSRCEVIRLRPASINSAQHYLELTRGLMAEQARLLAHVSGGRVGAALRLADDPTALEYRQAQIETLLELLPAARYERFKVAEQISKTSDKTRQNTNEVLLIWLSFWRDVFLRTSGGTSAVTNIDFEAAITQIAAQVSSETARNLVLAHERALKQLDAYANVRLLLESLVLQWPEVNVTDVSMASNGEIDR